ncbi:hypothetical protein AB0M44_37940 [Streptosporangium subroseum]|uniref:hypothetical protein n=1 Tax=Streptosporangium subroseum TaxID=106412 RepID=UPI003432E623
MTEFTQSRIPQPQRDGKGGIDTGPRNIDLDLQNPDMLTPPETDSGTIPNMKFCVTGSGRWVTARASGPSPHGVCWLRKRKVNHVHDSDKPDEDHGAGRDLSWRACPGTARGCGPGVCRDPENIGGRAYGEDLPLGAPLWS